MPKVTKRRVSRRHEMKERNIRAVYDRYNDDTEALAHYEVRVTGKTVGTYPNITGARGARDKAKGESLRGVPVVNRSDGRVTFKAVADKWLARRTDLAPRTRDDYRIIVNGPLAPLHDKSVNRVDRAAVKAFLAGLTTGAEHRRKVQFILGKVLNEAVDDGHLAANPTLGLPKPKKVRTLREPIGHADVQRLVDELSDHPYAGLLVELAAHSGLRAGELAGLQVADFNPLARAVTVRRSVVDVTKAGTTTRRLQVTTPKSDGSLRVVNELPADLCARLTAHVAGRGREAFIFGTGDSPHSHVNFYARTFRPAVLALGLSCRFHDLRHYHASACIEAGMTPLYVAHRLGHADAVLVLRTYGHLFPTAGNGLADRLASIRAAAPDAPSIASLSAKG